LTTIPGDGTFICTLSFIFKDTTHSPVRYYAGTAGHCVLPATAVATAGPGANYNAAGVTVQVCTTFCYVGGELSGLIGSMQNLGTVAYARQTQASAAPFCVSGDIGNDFALITIDSARYAQVKTSMAVWGGPYGQNSLEGTGSVLVHHGNGITFGTTIPTKARAGVSLNDGVVCSFQALINVAGGDSGSAISRGGTSNLVLGGEAALGTITHAIIGAGTPSFGTTLYRSFEMASVDAGISMVLCDASTTLATC
ncbi:MAG: hypothetical protein QOG31_1706, partial [Thermoplasmata archaeon]|nr:hypothetical protein [Thermoplasmata archaeon]